MQNDLKDNNLCHQNTVLYSISPWSLAIRRVPALLLTMSLELMGGVVIDQLHKVTLIHIVVKVKHMLLGYQSLHLDCQFHASNISFVW